jgi:signal transduction histidine kinase
MLKRLIGANMHLELRLAPALENIKADPGQVSQVVMNLIVNARDAMPDGGNITVSTANEEVTPATDGMRLPPKPGHYVTLTVSDTGTGMTPETAARVFEPFFTTKEQGQGTGLGLSTVHSIMLQTNGGIALKTSPGKGTAFKIYFPRTLERA